MTLSTFQNNILFRFLDPVNNKGEFVRGTTSFGLELLSGFDNSAKQPRWCEVIAIGPDVKEIQVGNVILLPALRWTERVEYEGGRFWKTNETEVVAVRADKSLESSMKLLNTFVVFTPKNPPRTTTVSGLVVVGSLTDDTASGRVLDISTEVEPDLAFQIIYYNGDNFTDTVTKENGLWAQEFSFIKEENILCYSEY